MVPAHPLLGPDSKVQFIWEATVSNRPAADNSLTGIPVTLGHEA